MHYEWDETKAEQNLKKHGIQFADAVAVFADESALTVDDPQPDEERYVTIGMDPFARLVVVVYTWRGEDTIRLISAGARPRTSTLSMLEVSDEEGVRFLEGTSRCR